jgi:CBS domain containing-hemolysin-like protein
MMDLHTLACAVPPLLLLEGFFSGSEIALLSADKLALKARTKQSRAARHALALSNQPERVLSTTLLMTSLCMISISALVSMHFLGDEHAELRTVLVTSPLVVILGELLPKTLYQRHATRIAPWVAYPVAAAYWLLYPVTRLLSAYTSRLSRVIGPIEELLTGKRPSTREDLLGLLAYGTRESEIKISERRMIKRIFDFKESEAKHALIPLVRVDAIELEATVREALARFEDHRHSRMPVFEGRIDNIVGVLETADLFLASDVDQSIHNYLTPAHYVAETQSLEDLMLDMRREDNEMVVVVDEHGGAVGILTFEDIVEEIVGEINDEYDVDLHAYKPLSETAWIVQARMEIQAINDQLRWELPQGEYETLSGFLLQQFGRIPEMRDELFFTTPAGEFKFTIRKATERHIEIVLVEILAKPEASTP